MNYVGLAIEGGGASGISYVGALRAYEDNGYKMSNFKYLAGSSAGSIICALLSCKCDIDWLENAIKNFNFSDLLDDSWGVTADIIRLYEEYGWYKGDALLNKVESMLKELTGKDNITFKEIYDIYGNTLIITKTQVLYPRCELVVMDHTTHPNHPVSLAVRESSSIPYFFKAVTNYNNDIFVDGGVLLNYPIELLYNYLPPNQCMGLLLKYYKQFNNEERQIQSHVEFIKAIAETWRDGIMNKNIGIDDNKRTCKIKTYIKSIDFDIDDRQKNIEIDSGYDCMVKFITKHKK